MQPDLQCTHWPDGIPTWLGGRGNEWLHCCVKHDLSDLPRLASDVKLFQCVWATGYWPVAVVMFLGLVTIGLVYRWIRHGPQQQTLRPPVLPGISIDQIPAEIFQRGAKTMPQTTSLTGRIEIMSHEGCVLSPYRDSVGIWTVFVGHTASAGLPDPRKMVRGREYPMSEALAVFAKDLGRFEARVRSAFTVALTQAQFDAAVSFDFNTGGIDRASWVKAFNQGKISEARRLFMNWKKPPEIIPRRRKERELFFNGVYSSGGVVPVYPADASGRVLWGQGRRINALTLMNGGQSEVIPKDAMADGILERGETGPAVGQLIADLRNIGFEISDAGENGRTYTAEVEDCVRHFQVQNKLQVDGKAGPQTFRRVRAEIERAEPKPPTPAPVEVHIPTPVQVPGIDKPMLESKTNWTAFGGFATTALTALSAIADWRVALAVIALAAGIAVYIMRERWKKADASRKMAAQIQASANLISNQARSLP